MSLLASLGSLLIPLTVDFDASNSALSSSAQPAPAKPVGEKKITNSVEMALVLIAAGDFLMGAPVGDDLAQQDEKPQHRIRISRPFYLAAYETTLAQFRAFVEEISFKTAAETDGKGTSGYNSMLRGFEYDNPQYSWRNPGYQQDDKHPVVNVNWHDARAFCEWLSKKEGRRYRLPTEAEWEYACRAGSTARFTVGDNVQDLRAVANLCDQSLSERWDTSTVKKYGIDPKIIKFQPWNDAYPFTAPVGSFKPNAFGLFDMLGNVGEFCSDRYQADYYRESPAADPTGPGTKKETHVVRGGTRFSMGRPSFG